MKIFKGLFTSIWAVIDVLMFLGAAITINITMFSVSRLAGGIGLSVTFILAGLTFEIIEAKKGSD